MKVNKHWLAHRGGHSTFTMIQLQVALDPTSSPLSKEPKTWAFLMLLVGSPSSQASPLILPLLLQEEARQTGHACWINVKSLILTAIPWLLSSALVTNELKRNPISHVIFQSFGALSLQVLARDESVNEEPARAKLP